MTNLSDDDDDAYEQGWLAGETEYSDYPEEEEDEDNPDWYRLPDPSDLWEDLEEAAALEDSDDPSFLTASVRDGEASTHRPQSRRKPSTAARPADVDLYYDGEGFYAYVLARRSPVPFGVRDAQQLTADLEGEGIEVVKSGQSFQPASDGVQYDWYLRVQVQGRQKPANQAIDRVLAMYNSAGGVRNAEQRVHFLEHELATASAEKAEVRRELELALQTRDTARRERESLRQRLAEVTAQFDEERRRAAQAHVDINVLLLELRSARESEQRGEASDQIVAQLQARIEEQQGVIEREQQRAFHDLKAYAAELEEEKRQRDIEREEAENTIEQLRATHADRRRGSNDTATKNRLRRTVEALLPRMRFHGPSFDILHKELADPFPVLEMIGELQSRGTLPNDRKMEGAPPWRRVHFRTGTNDDGRLYFARDAAEEKLHVVISRKDQQKEDVQYLRSIAI